MQIQRLRNLTTQILHTDMGDVYEDLEHLFGQEGLFTHMLPRVLRACEPWLRAHVPDPRFWEQKLDTAHTGEIDLPTPSAEDRREMLVRYFAQPDPLANTRVVAVSIS